MIYDAFSSNHLKPMHYKHNMLFLNFVQVDDHFTNTSVLYVSSFRYCVLVSFVSLLGSLVSVYL